MNGSLFTGRWDGTASLTHARNVTHAGVMQEQQNHRRGIKLALLGGLGVVVVGISWWILRSHSGDLLSLADQGVSQVREVGVTGFFLLMALLPALGCPMSVFTLTAGPVFAPTLGMPLVILLVWLSLALNLALTFWLARYALRPWMIRLVSWMGYTLPEVKKSNHRGMVILVRVTPGPPYVLQSYLLGLAGIPFGTYFYISWIISSLYSCAFVLFGDALMQGKGRMALLAIGLFAALTVGVQLLRRHYRMRRDQAQA